MYGLLLAWLLASPPGTGHPPGWKVVLSRGAAPVVQNDRVITRPGQYVKWLIADRCLISLEAETAVVFSPGAGLCPGVHLVEGTIRVAASASDPVDLTWAGGARRIVGLVTLSVSGGRLVNGPVASREPAPDTVLSLGASPIGQLQTRLGSLLRETFSGSGDTLVQTGASGSMCLDSGGSAGDVGNNQTGITQMPPGARLRVRIPSPRPEAGR